MILSQSIPKRCAPPHGFGNIRVENLSGSNPLNSGVEDDRYLPGDAAAQRAVYRPQDDTSLLIEAPKRQRVTGSTRVLDLCAGTGALSIAAAKAGAGRILAVDISRRSIVNVRLNRLRNKASAEARRGDLTEVLNGEKFDLVVSNPPHVPSEIDELPASGLERAWNAGTGGRVLLDRIITSAPDFLAPGGSLLLLQSAMCDIGKTEAMLEERG